MPKSSKEATLDTKRCPFRFTLTKVSLHTFIFVLFFSFSQHSKIKKVTQCPSLEFFGHFSGSLSLNNQLLCPCQAIDGITNPVLKTGIS